MYIHVCMYIYIYIYTQHVCIHIYIYIYIHIYIHIICIPCSIPGEGGWKDEKAWPAPKYVCMYVCM